ncbi:16S rRNA (cytosine(1402)-N(4))-methyltransferase RsmH [Rhodopirellula sp. MGV]|uniref:16S rRNA (cytosine(1402)-N(4))-methyltransferase RsmH n=1 Tax=Rhodopirellula sp. MGV TaxID=2023130 RepID=UPI000B96667B|nr:16S rRNA (cytosine(1402)-N(4))-methyltransferase RsmH [Rhodopirellula sp. MGV]OYP29492.1 16S rRNA (cytosine(1402)-N(4))-methyltransferase [Rhodopirellula sp. MGV]PNY33795.1 16S rRNA (cytosine(1402)-N(4))-methyltransferase RsmH [Rhodopirellula baltica]
MEEADQSNDSCHVSVMPDEIVEWVSGCKPKVVIDGTFGGGGHSRRMIDEIESLELVIGLDRDPAVVRRDDDDAIDRLSVFLASYEQAAKALAACEVDHADAMVLDLGLSSDQLADRERGFSFQFDGPLDLRFDPENGIPASEWLARQSEKAIADAIYQFGEERYSRRIAREVIAAAKRREPVRTVHQMSDICRRCVPRSKNHDIHPATRTFQALRIVVNDELGILTRTLQAAPDWLSVGGRMVVISFHSLEDRIVKQAFREDDRWNILTKKPLRPTDAEVAANPRARSAKLRIAERCD